MWGGEGKEYPIPGGLGAELTHTLLTTDLEGASHMAAPQVTVLTLREIRLMTVSAGEEEKPVPTLFLQIKFVDLYIFPNSLSSSRLFLLTQVCFETIFFCFRCFSFLLSWRKGEEC